MSDRAPYSRVYWTVRSDPRLAEIYRDDHHWAAWNRLLLAADMAWPAPADLPSTVRASSLRVLVDKGVVETLPGGLFRFHGLDAERGRRKASASASQSGRTRPAWDPDGVMVGPVRHPNGTQTGPERDPKGSLDETRRDETSLDEPRRAETGAGEGHPGTGDAADDYWRVTGSYPSDRVRSWIDRLAGQHGHDAVGRAIAAEHAADGDASSLMGRVRDRLARDARAADRAEQADEARRVEARRAPLRALRREPDPTTPEEAERIAAEYIAAHPGRLS